MTILRMCEWTTGKTVVPLFHIVGKHNLADLLTKKHECGLCYSKLCVADWFALDETEYQK